VGGGRQDVLSCLDRIEVAAEEARQALSAVIESAKAGRSEWTAAPSMEYAGKYLGGSGERARQDAGDAVDRYLRAARLLRIVMVRALVDELGVTLTEVGRQMGISRQMVARLYRGL
jgi:hypothetical protein